MTSRWWSNDDELFEALGRALRARQEVPSSFVEAGKAAFAWHNIDAELAALTYDSSLDERLRETVTRAEPASLRALTFTSPQLSIELEITPDSLVGQVVPPQPGEVELHVPGGTNRTVPVDDVGSFVIRSVSSRSFRLHCRTVTGTSVLTNWITI